MTTKTTVYLTDELKGAITREARRRGVKEAEVIRAALAAGLQRPAINGALFDAPPFAAKTDDALEGFGER